MKLNILIPFLLVGTSLFAQNYSQKLDSLFNSLYTYRQINGNVLVAENGSSIYKKSFGFADFENKTLNSDNTRFALASVSKVFTSTAILQLKDKDKLKLDDPFIKFFSDFPYPDITIRNLLSHTSGLPDYDLYEEQIDQNPNKIFSNTDVLPSLKMWKKTLSSRPGEKWEYSNTNFCLLALLVEKLSGLEFQKYLQKHIFTPAKMNNTYFQTDSLRLKDNNRAINYEYRFLFSLKYQNVDSLKKYRWRLYNVSGFIGQGNIITTTDDLLKFDNLLYLGKILKPSTFEEAFTPTKLKNGETDNASIG